MNTTAAKHLAICLAIFTALSSHASDAPKPAEPAASDATKSAPEVQSKPKGFEALQVGMTSDEVNETIGAPPTKYHTYESGKRWIPFYFGSDSVRLMAHYAGQGCAIFSIGHSFRNHGSEWKDVSGTLREIIQDKSGACYQP